MKLDAMWSTAACVTAGVAAAAVYVASRLCGTPRTQREIADISGVTEVTIRNRYKEIVGQLGLERDLS